MSVYKEFYFGVQEIQLHQVPVFNDAIDVGVPVKKGDKFWKLSKSLKRFANEGVKSYQTDFDTSIIITGLDEWAVSDRRKTVEQATDHFKMSYTILKTYKNKPYLNPAFKNADGFLTITKIR